jgi:hypothetical protein
MKRALAAATASIALAALTLAPSAGAATEFGSNCAATAGESDLVLTDLSHSAAEPLPAVAPTSGIITQGKTTIGLSFPAGVLSVTLQVYRAAGPSQFTLVGQSAPAPVSPGANTFAARVPVQAGDHVGFSGQAGGEQVGLFCETEDPADLMAYAGSPPPLGGTGTFKTVSGYRAPIAAVIEPDADNDGFGDETQDGCPQSAAVQTPCPLVALDTSAKAGKKAVTVSIAAGSEGSVGVKGVVKLGKGKKATLKAKAKTVFPGKLATFKLKFNAKVIKRLKELEPSQKLTLKVTASATNVAGQVSSDKLKVKLKGQG